MLRVPCENCGVLKNPQEIYCDNCVTMRFSPSPKVGDYSSTRKRARQRKYDKELLISWSKNRGHEKKLPGDEENTWRDH